MKIPLRQFEGLSVDPFRNEIINRPEANTHLEIRPTTPQRPSLIKG